MNALLATLALTFLLGLPLTAQAVAPDCDITSCSTGNGWGSPGDRDPNDGVDPNRK